MNNKKLFTLNRIRYKNIMSVGQKFIDIRLDEHHKVLVTGKNGHGKSTLLEAITFAMFGKPFRDINKAQLINTFNKKELLVELWLTYAGKEYYIKRGQKPNIFEFTIDGESLNESASVKDFQEEFEKSIGMNYNSFKQVVVLGTAGYTPFMGLTPATRRKLVEDLLEISILANMDKNNKTEIRNLNQKIQITDANINHIKSQIQTHKDYAEKQKKLSGDNLIRLQDMYDQNLSEAKVIRDEIDQINEKIIKTQVDDFDDTELQDVTKQYTVLNSEIGSGSKVLRLYSSGGDCPTCMQKLSNVELVQSIKDKLDADSLRLIEIGKQSEVLKNKCDEIRKIRNLVSSYENEISVKRSNVRLLVDKVKKIKGAIEEASKEKIDNSHLIVKEQKLLEEEINNKSAFVMEKYERSVILDMLKDNGIKSAIVKKYIPLFNKKINYYLNLLEADYVFNLDSEFKETIKSRGREEFSYSSFSQGEKGRIDLALLFTWRDIAELVSGIRISCLIMDEVTDTAGLDVDGYKNLTSILDSMKDFNFFIISHKEQDTAKYDRRIGMKKVGRFTCMEDL